ncbi:hypothetical protein HZA85_03450 [Candidatus Uhrbacteria bacterium]|nr:hypothetical protein [Candidatus Uhrbacteria bacterium]
MSFRWFLLVMALATCAAWIGWVFVVHSVDPTHAGLLGFLLFYLTLLVAVLGSTVFFGALIRVWMKPQEIPYRQTVRALRQGVLLTFLFLSVLILISFELLRWWTGGLLILLCALIELLFLTKHGRNGSTPS